MSVFLTKQELLELMEQPEPPERKHPLEPRDPTVPVKGSWDIIIANPSGEPVESMAFYGTSQEARDSASDLEAQWPGHQAKPHWNGRTQTTRAWSPIWGWAPKKQEKGTNP